MNAKNAVIELVQGMPETVTVPDIIQALRAMAVPAEAGPAWSSDDVSYEDWAKFVSASLADELNDSRQDIYSLEDGQPYDVAR